MDSIRIKRGLKAQLPRELPLGELAFCTDTRELYVGMGEGSPLRPITNKEITDHLDEWTDTFGNLDKKYQDKFVEISNQFQNKYNGLETEYAQRLDSVSSLSSLLINLKIEGIREGEENAQNNTLILTRLITEHSTGKVTFYLPKGTYYFNPINLTNIEGAIVIRLKGENDGMSTSWFKNIATKICTNKQDFIYDKRPKSPGITFYVDDMRIVSYEGYKEIPSGVCFGAEDSSDSEFNFHFYNVIIHGFDYGFRSPAFTCAGSGGKNVSISTCHYGIYIQLASHLFNLDCVELTYNRVGIRFGHGGSPCSVSNIHLATGYLGADREQFDRYIGIHCKGDVVISKLYQEAYEPSALPERTTVIDYEGWAFGIGPVIIQDTPIAKPTNGGGLFFRGRTYLGAGPETDTSSPTEIYSGNLGHYPDGCAKFINCRLSNKTSISDLTSIFDVPNQSPGYDINGLLFYKNSHIISKNAVGKVNSKWNHAYWGITTIDKGTFKYDSYIKTRFEEPYEGFVWDDLKVFKDLDSVADVHIQGNIIIEDTLSSNIDVEIGILHQYFDIKDAEHEVAHEKFYTIASLKGHQSACTLPFNFFLQRFDGENYRTHITLTTKYKDSDKRLTIEDFTKIRLQLNTEVQRNMMF